MSATSYPGQKAFFHRGAATDTRRLYSSNRTRSLCDLDLRAASPASPVDLRCATRGSLHSRRDIDFKTIATTTKQVHAFKYISSCR